MIYSLIFLFIFLFGFLEITSLSKKSSRVLFLISLLAVWALQAFRWTSGTDWLPYWDYFVNTESCADYFESQFEAGFAAFNYIIGLFTRNYTIYLMLYSALLMCLYYKIARDSSIYLCLVLLFFYCTTIFPVRQMLAMGFVFCSYKYIVDRQFIKFLIVIFLAFSIHRTAIIFLPVYFIARYHFSNTVLIVFYLTGVFLGIEGFIFDWILNIFLRVGLGMEGAAADKLLFYLSANQDAETISFTRFLFSMLSNFVWIVLFLYFRKKISNEYYNVLLNIYFINLFLNRLFVIAFSDLTRISLFFTGAFILLMTMILAHIKSSNRVILYVLVSVYCYAQMMQMLYGRYSDLYLPYISVFSGVERPIY